MKYYRILSLLFVLLMGTAVACTQPQTPPTGQASPSPTLTATSLPQTTVAARPEVNPTITPTATISPTVTSTSTRAVTTYTIQVGDTLFNISNRFEVTVEEIAEANNLTNPDSIAAGQTLLIPEQAVEVTAVSPTDTPQPTNTPPIVATETNGEQSGTAVPPEALEPTGRLEITHPLAMVVEESGVITVEIIADPELTEIGEHEPHVTGVVRIDASYNDGERAYYEQTIELFPLMAAELNAPAFEVFPSGGDNIRLPRVISTTLPAVWTWDIIATTPGETQIITVNLYKEPTTESGIPILTQSISRTIQVVAKSRWQRIVDGIADNVLLLLGTGGPLGLLLAYLTYRTSQENERLKKEVTDLQRKETALEKSDSALEPDKA